MVLRKGVGGGGGGGGGGGSGRIDGWSGAHVGGGVLRRRRCCGRVLEVEGHGEIGSAGARAGVRVGELGGRRGDRHSSAAKRRRNRIPHRESERNKVSIL